MSPPPMSPPPMSPPPSSPPPSSPPPAAPPPEPLTLYNITVTAYDGYYSGCSVASAPYLATTSTAGVAAFLDVGGPLVRSSVPLQALPCADTFTSLPVPYSFSTIADVDQSGTGIVMNTLTTLMTTIYEATPGSTPATAASTVLTALGLPAGIDLPSFDAIVAGDTPAGAATLATMSQVSAIVVQGAALMEGALGADPGAATAALFSSLAAVASGTTIDVTSDADLEAIFSGAVVELTSAPPSADLLQAIAEVADATQNLNTLIANALASGLTGNALVIELSKLAIVSQTVMAEATEDLGDGTIDSATYAAATTDAALAEVATSVADLVNTGAIDSVLQPEPEPFVLPILNIPLVFVTDECDKDEWKWPCQNAKIMVGVFASLGGCIILAVIFLAGRGGKSSKVVAPAS